MQMTNKFRPGELIFLPSGVSLYKDVNNGFHAYGTMTAIPTLGVYLGKKISDKHYHDINVNGYDYWISEDELSQLNSPEV